MSGSAASNGSPASMADAPAPAPFTMMVGDAAAPVCEGDVCVIPGTSAAS